MIGTSKNRFLPLEVQIVGVTSSTSKTKKSCIKPRFFRFKAGTLNCRTASDEVKLALILRECAKAGLTFVCLQETRILGKHDFELVIGGEKWRVIGSGANSKIHGVAFCYKISKHVEIEDYQQISSRMLEIKCKIAGTELRILCIYAPTNTYATSTKTLFYRDLGKLVNSETGTRRKLICFGDFNGYCSAFDDACKFDGDASKFESYKSTESGDLFLDFCGETKLSSLATHFTHKICQRSTFYSNDKRTVRVLDHVLARNWVKKNTIDTRVKNGIKIDSDHRCLVSTFSFPLYKRDRRLTKKKRRKSTPKHDLLLFRKNDDLQTEFLNAVTESIEGVSELSMADIMNIITSASSVIPKKQKAQTIHPWDTDSQLQEFLEKRDKIDRNKQKSEFTKLTGKIRKRAKFLKNEFLQAEAEKINQAWYNRELEKTYSLAKDHKIGKQFKTGNKCPDHLLKAHVREHLNKEIDIPIPEEISTNVPECLKTGRSIPFNDQLLTADAPAKDELLEAIRRLKNNKSSTDCAAECLKVAIDSDDFADAIHSAIERVWTERMIPEEWRISRITCLFKKGSRLLPENYRTLSVSSVVLKAIMSIILVRSSAWYEAMLHDSQNGFRAARGCADSVFIAKNIVRIAKAHNKSVYSLALDLRAAYDWVRRNWVFLAIAARNSDADCEKEIGDLFELVRLLYERTYSFMSGDTEKDAFQTTCGLLQGGVESPPLFSIFCDTVMRLFVDELEKLGVGGFRFKYFIPASASTRAQRVMNPLTGEQIIYYTAYCDDIQIYAESIEQLQKMTDVLEHFFTKFGLTICKKKTKSLILNWSGKIEDYPKNIVSIQGVNIENVSVFKYLGVKFDVEQCNTGETEIKYRIILANAKFRDMKHVFENKNIRLGTRLMFYNAFVRSRLCFLCGTWCITQKLRKKLETCQSQHLRSMVRGGWARKGGSRELQDEIGYNFAYLYNSTKIYKLTKSETVLNFVDFQRAKWVSHVVRTDNDRLIKQSMFEQTQNSREGRTVSVLDQFLKETRNYDFEDSEVYRACIDRDLFWKLRDRGVVFATRLDGD